METYSIELAAELGGIVDLSVLPLAGRSGGRPPSLLALAAFLVRSAFYLLWRRWQFEVVHFGDLVLFPLAFWHGLVAPRASRFVTVHGLDLLYGNRKGFKPAIYRRFVAWAARRRCVNGFLANSRNTADIATRFGFAPVEVVPLGVRIPENKPPEPRSSATPYVLFIGRIVKRKGAAWFAENVLPLLPGDVEFHVAGKAWDTDEEARLKRAPGVKLHGYAPDDELERLMVGARVIVMPNLRSADASDVEGFGLVALEAAISGTPLVAASIDGLSDAVIDKRTGFLVPPENAFAWADQISRILRWTEEERASFAALALHTVRREYSWKRVAEDTLNAYRNYRFQSSG